MRLNPVWPGANALATLALIFGFAVASTAAHAAWHDEGMLAIPGWVEGPTDLYVHYVRLKGRKGNLALALRDKDIAQAQLQQCVPNPLVPARRLGEGERLVEGFPEFVDYFEIEIYYARNRTLTVNHHTRYFHELRSCAIVELKGTSLQFRSTAGICDVSMKFKTARRNCDMGEHVRAGLPLVLTDPARLDGPRPQLVAGNYASTQCRRYHLGILQPIGDFEVCIAQAPGAGAGPNPVPPEGFHLAVSGVLLEAKGAIDMQAEEVRWNLLVSSSLFSIPPGFDVKSGVTSRGSTP
jgi:hypothetical protein